MSLARQVRALASGVVWDPVNLYEKIATGGTPNASDVGAPGTRAGLTLVGIVAVLLGLASASLAAPNRALFTGGILVFAAFLAASTTIWLVSRLLGGRAAWGSVLTAWAGSYVPSAIWFGSLILAQLMASPVGGPATDPISLRFPEAAWFQVLFLAFTLAMFLWKSLLLYLNLRILGRLDFRRIVLAALILGTVVTGYWLFGLYLGWFKVPII